MTQTRLEHDLLGRACRTLAERCLDGITANREVCRRMVERSIGLVTALATGDSVYDIVLANGYLSKAALDEILSPENMPNHVTSSEKGINQKSISIRDGFFSQS